MNCITFPDVKLYDYAFCCGFYFMSGEDYCFSIQSRPEIFTNFPKIATTKKLLTKLS